MAVGCVYDVCYFLFELQQCVSFVFMPFCKDWKIPGKTWLCRNLFLDLRLDFPDLHVQLLLYTLFLQALPRDRIYCLRFRFRHLYGRQNPQKGKSRNKVLDDGDFRHLWCSCLPLVALYGVNFGILKCWLVRYYSVPGDGIIKTSKF